MDPGGGGGDPPDRVDDLHGRATNRIVTRSRDEHMVLCWTAAGMFNAERSFRRVKGYPQMSQLVATLHRHAHPLSNDRAATVSAAG